MDYSWDGINPAGKPIIAPHDEIPTSQVESVEQCQIMSARPLRAVGFAILISIHSEMGSGSTSIPRLLRYQSPTYSDTHCTEASDVQRADGAPFWIRWNTMRA